MKLVKGIIIIAVVITLFGAYKLLSKPEVSEIRQQVVAKYVADFSISPDGRQIAFVDTAGLELTSIDGKNKKLLLPLHIEPEQWTSRARWPAYLGMRVVWSPDGHMVAVSAYDMREESSKLNIIDTQTKKTQIIDKSGFSFDPVWSPDSKRLAWIGQYRTNPQKSLSVQVVTATITDINGHLQASKVRCPIPQKFHPFGPPLVWVNGSKQLAAGIKDVILITPGKSVPSAVSPDTALSEFQFCRPIAWELSPDGKTMAFGLSPRHARPPRYPKNIPGTLWIRPTGGGHAKQLLVDRVPVAIAWTPDGRSILFANDSGEHVAPGLGFIPGPPHTLHMVSANGKSDRELWIEKEGIRKMQCTRDGKVLYTTLNSYKLCTARYK
ncbi:MAG: WD40 repeat domain-containing protein [Armatimonadota bacterium]